MVEKCAASISREKYNSNIFADNTQQFLQLFRNKTQSSREEGKRVSGK